MRPGVLQASLPGWIDPEEVFLRLFSSDDRVVWLDSGIHASHGMSYIGTGNRTLSATVGTDSISTDSISVDGVQRRGTVFEFLRAEAAAPLCHESDFDPVAGFRLGWVGWLGYELRAQTMGVRPEHRSRYPDAALLFVDRAIVFDHALRTVSAIALDEEALAALLDMMNSDHPAIPMIEDSPMIEASHMIEGGPPVGSRADWANSDEQYLDLIRKCQSKIRAGDVYQLCLTTEVRVDVHPDPVASYLALRASSPSHHGAFFRLGELSLLSSSPEVFLTVSPRGTIESRPIKGTRRRGRTPAEDSALIDELRDSDKERAENLMIVDLMRNDIGRVSAIGSVTVPTLLAVESYAQVHQLVSTVRGRLADGLDPIDAVMACFPAGSMTGAPKHSAVTILDRLEGRARGAYSGAFGYFGRDGRIELSMIIRSILLDPSGATVGTGGGITALSVPEEELAEVKLKAAALLEVLGVH